MMIHLSRRPARTRSRRSGTSGEVALRIGASRSTRMNLAEVRDRGGTRVRTFSGSAPAPERHRSGTEVMREDATFDLAVAKVGFGGGNIDVEEGVFEFEDRDFAFESRRVDYRRG